MVRSYCCQSCLFLRGICVGCPDGYCGLIVAFCEELGLMLEVGINLWESIDFVIVAAKVDVTGVEIETLIDL